MTKDIGGAPPGAPGLLRGRRGVLALMAAALVFRLVLSSQTIVHQPDEVWQYLEPAYGMVTGHWVVTWEYHAMIRGWLVPMMLVPMVAVGHALAPASQLHIWLVRGVLSLLSLGVVASFYSLAARTGRAHALVAGWVAAIWVEVFYFAPRSSGEGIALSLLLPAIALLYRLRERPGFAAALAAGALLTLGAIVRFQYGPAIALLALWGGYGHRDKLWRPLLVGAALALVLGGLADALAGQVPFLWIARNFAINLGEGRSAQYGTLAPGWYVRTILTTWGWTSLLLLPAIAAGARRLPMLLVVAMVVIACHTAVPHKEYRFVLLAVALLLLLAAVGSVDLAQWIAGHGTGGRRWVLPLLGCVWFAMSLTVGLSQPFVGYWGSGRYAMTSMIDAGRRPDLCGLAIVRAYNHPLASYAFLNRGVPILMFGGPGAEAAAAARRDSFNVVIAPRLAASALPPEYRLDHCLQAGLPPVRQAYCTYVRPGTCHGGAGDFAYNLVLTRIGH